jgi:uncharacterized membrane protein YedE/YeeE
VGKLQTYLFGVVFGFLLVRAGATDHALMMRMFLLEDPHMAGVMGVAIGLAAFGLHVIRRFRIRTLQGLAPPMNPKPERPHWLLGSLLFGVGWALTGTCPGTALAQVGEGQLVGLFTVLGLVLGSALHLRFGKSREG